jgi:hypothetical protein
MNPEEIPRKKLDNQEFFKLRQVTEKVAHALGRRLANHLDILRPLFIPRRLLGTYVKSAVIEEVPRSEKAFADLQELYSTICEKPFGLPKKLQPPLPPISNQLEMTPLQYPLCVEGSGDKTISVTSPTQWILSYRSECPINRLKAMVFGSEPRQPDEMRQALINHLSLVILLRHVPNLTQLLEDLRYHVKIRDLVDLGNLPVIVLKAPVQTFLPPDDFILQVTQLSGIPAFQEIIDLEAVENILDSLKETLKNIIG